MRIHFDFQTLLLPEPLVVLVTSMSREEGLLVEVDHFLKITFTNYGTGFRFAFPDCIYAVDCLN